MNLKPLSSLAQKWDSHGRACVCELSVGAGNKWVPVLSFPVLLGCTLGGRSWGSAEERGPYLHGNLRLPTEQVGTMPKCCVGGGTVVDCLPDKVWTLYLQGPEPSSHLLLGPWVVPS